MRYLSLSEIIELHLRVVEASGGGQGIRDLAGLKSAVSQPRMTFSGSELYPTIEEKDGALCFSLILNHPFLDGNKRVAGAGRFSCIAIRGGPGAHHSTVGGNPGRVLRVSRRIP